MEVKDHHHSPAALPPGKVPSDTHWIGGWVGSRAGLDAKDRRQILHLLGIEPLVSSA
jgi:hypothetical protein